ncbi:hypothetical protein L6164_028986 [Bauhinia variegata]|uniref:Uncharacterized protein n=1 Tax=Bauhinia variegata TaxID=167791 RepID=A0ACB9L7X7_BAUVA|nr:hypothetical protein L6164_028986 [Bauhinia variegata]
MVMGSFSRGNDGEGTSGVQKLDEDYGQDLNFPPAELPVPYNVINGFSDPMAQLTPQGSRAHQPSLVVTQQVLTVPLQRTQAIPQQPQQQALLQNEHLQYVVLETQKRVKISWNHSGMNVAITGSWDNWRAREPMERIGHNFVIMKTLPIGVYHYRFIVDGYWTHAPEFPWSCDDSSCGYNILDLQDYIPETLARLSDFDPPASPPSSYDNTFLNDDEFSKPPPELPPQLPVTIREDPSSSGDGHLAFPKPNYLELNHLYVNKIEREPFVALRATHRFEHKYVTVVLYKPLRRGRQ